MTALQQPNDVVSVTGAIDIGLTEACASTRVIGAWAQLMKSRRRDG
jgi:hypothetical protein